MRLKLVFLESYPFDSFWILSIKVAVLLKHCFTIHPPTKEFTLFIGMAPINQRKDAQRVYIPIDFKAKWGIGLQEG